MRIPTDYGAYRLEAVYGPFVYPEVNEKTIGVMTVGDQMRFLMSYNETIVTPQTAQQIRDTARVLPIRANACTLTQSNI